MVTAESLCCGTPVVGFKAGAPEMITLPQFSCFVAQGDTDALHGQVQQYLCRSKPEGIAAAAAQKYDRDTMYRNYLTIYEEQIAL